MKKLLLVALVGLFAFSLTACKEEESGVPVFAGAVDQTVEIDTTFDALDGVTAEDAEDGDLTADIVVTGDVDTSTVGEYTVTYTVTDSDGNEVEVEVTITVEYGPRTVITYAGWNVGTAEANNLTRRLIAEFNATNPMYEIEIVEYEGNYNEFLATRAAAGDFPDVVLSGNVPDFIVAGYAGDITSVAEADDEWTDIPQNLRDAVTYNGKVFAIPSSTNYLGMFANLDLIDDANITTDFTTLDYTYDEWIAAIEAATDTTRTDGTSTAGITIPTSIVNWLPAVLDQEAETPLGIGHFVYNGEEFLLNSQVMKDALAEAASIVSNQWSVSAYSTAPTGPLEDQPSEREQLFGSNWDGFAFRNGLAAFNWDGTWATSLQDNADDAGFDLQFVGLPGGNVVGVQDFMTISKTTDNLEGAFEVAKWLSFGADGINARFDIVENTVPDTENGESALSIAGLPVNSTQAIVDKWFENYPVAGVQEWFEAAATGEVTVLNEGNKFVPGFLWARFWYDTGIDATISRPDNDPGSTLSIGDLIWDSQLGRIVYSDYMTPELEAAINYEFAKAYNALLLSMLED
ncbi:extracellular solute-binding protein [Candidatus Xianfuyuplasma coldseepsis]|uniref:Extracellular solute-binding protein n=1 Tax=Candidatus Xianfuyuplasma coldseepsis TaxID=2782163 RepID=A0A7L7KQW0_9MOLU|nr:immunoglobulin-like domain-containing protein [Xianfuyuplasma coldseepsis]QMS85067.1 extracellular solute-binding protein [Xianfuyuplasma coldseepsis]